MYKYRAREEAAKQIKVPIMLKQNEIEDIKYASKVVASAVHPDTGEVIPAYMRMSGFVIFNLPLLFAMLFTKS